MEKNSFDSGKSCLNDTFRFDNEFCCCCPDYWDCIGITDESDDFIFEY